MKVLEPNMSDASSTPTCDECGTAVVAIIETNNGVLYEACSRCLRKAAGLMLAAEDAEPKPINREARLVALGFELPSAEQRAQNVREITDHLLHGSGKRGES